MCVQYTVLATGDLLAEKLSTNFKKTLSWPSRVFPGYLAPVAFQNSKSKIEIDCMEYGLIPWFEKNEKPKKRFHNARSETVFEKTSFAKEVVKQRCLVPITSFFEFVPKEYRREDKDLIRVSGHEEEILWALGIYNQWVSPKGEKHNSFSIITRGTPDSQGFLSWHDRFPVFLKLDSGLEWIKAKESTEMLLNQLLSESRVSGWKFDFEKRGSSSTSKEKEVEQKTLFS